MSTVIMGVQAKLLVSTTAAGPKTDVTGVGIGIDGLTRAAAGQMYASAGSGVIASQLDNFDSHDFSINVPSDATHDPLFRQQNGRRLWCTYAPEGTETGTPLFTFEAVVHCTLALTSDPDNVRWTIQFMVDGKPVESMN